MDTSKWPKKIVSRKEYSVCLKVPTRAGNTHGRHYDWANEWMNERMNVWMNIEGGKCTLGSAGGIEVMALEPTWLAMWFESQTRRFESHARNMFVYAQNPERRHCGVDILPWEVISHFHSLFLSLLLSDKSTYPVTKQNKTKSRK